MITNPSDYVMLFSVSPPRGTPREQYRWENGVRLVKQNVTAFTGKCIIVSEADDFWNATDEESKPYRSKVLVNPTWADLFACAKQAQKKTGDLHHAFFEGVRAAGKKVVSGEEVTILHLELGS